jgi:hypothetical protein
LPTAFGLTPNAFSQSDNPDLKGHQRRLRIAQDAVVFSIPSHVDSHERGIVIEHADARGTNFSAIIVGQKDPLIVIQNTHVRQPWSSKGRNRWVPSEK